MPFAGYKDFADCVAKNSSKKDPKAYCGTIQAAAEGAEKLDFQVRTSIKFQLDDTAVFEEVDGRMMASIRVLRAGKSKNRRNYSPAIVKEAVDNHVFDRARMFRDHDRKRANPQERSINEMVSIIESTSYDDVSHSMNGRVEFFDRPFYEYAQRAKDYIGVSINALVKGTRQLVAGEVHEEITGWGPARSVDWVMFPAAGGSILAFEDEDVVTMPDWTQITAEDLKTNAPEVYESILASAEPPPKVDPPKKEPTPEQKPDIAKLVAEAIDEERTKANEKAARQKTAGDAVREAFKNSGLPTRTQTRVMASFEGVEEYDEKAVAEAIKSAKEELQEVGAGPRISGMGPSTGGGSTVASQEFSVHESVRSAFGIKKEASKEAAD